MVSTGLADNDPQIMDAFTGVYLIRLDTDAWSYVWNREVIPVFGDVSVIPVFFRLDADGKPTGDIIDGGAWGPDTYENIANTMGPWFKQP
jgi:hypothetical protein